jgi:hypothetical protein
MVEVFPQPARASINKNWLLIFPELATPAEKPISPLSANQFSYSGQSQVETKVFSLSLESPEETALSFS